MHTVSAIFTSRSFVTHRWISQDAIRKPNITVTRTPDSSGLWIFWNSFAETNKFCHGPVLSCLFPIYSEHPHQDLNSEQFFGVVTFVPVVSSEQAILSYLVSDQQETPSPRIEPRTVFRGCGFCFCDLLETNNFDLDAFFIHLRRQSNQGHLFGVVVFISVMSSSRQTTLVLALSFHRGTFWATGTSPTGRQTEDISTELSSWVLFLVSRTRHAKFDANRLSFLAIWANSHNCSFTYKIVTWDTPSYREVSPRICKLNVWAYRMCQIQYVWVMLKETKL